MSIFSIRPLSDDEPQLQRRAMQRLYFPASQGAKYQGVHFLKISKKVHAASLPTAGQQKSLRWPRWIGGSWWRWLNCPWCKYEVTESKCYNTGNSMIINILWWTNDPYFFFSTGLIFLLRFLQPVIGCTHQRLYIIQFCIRKQWPSISNLQWLLAKHLADKLSCSDLEKDYL